MRWLLLLPGAVAVWLMAGLLGAAIPVAGEPPGEEVEIGLVGTAIHYDFLLPATPETRAALGFARRAGVPLDDPAVAWILVGWGAHDFYTSTGRYADIGAGPVLRAITGDGSVLRIDVWPAFDDPATLRLRLSGAQYERLLAAIAGMQGGPVLDHPGFTRTDAFVAAHGRFHLLRTCNVWIGEMLRAAGLRFGAWTPTPQAVRLSVSLHL
nr:DUF2459 domain-containing protein [Jannaschia sp. S6380]